MYLNLLLSLFYFISILLKFKHLTVGQFSRLHGTCIKDLKQIISKKHI